MTKKIYKKEDILNDPSYSVTKWTGPADFEDEFGNVFNIDEVTEQAERDIEALKQEKNLNMRWYASELNRAKKIAKAKGFSGYQTYIKTILKQAMDKDEKEIGLI